MHFITNYNFCCRFHLHVIKYISYFFMIAFDEISKFVMINDHHCNIFFISFHNQICLLSYLLFFNLIQFKKYFNYLLKFD